MTVTEQELIDYAHHKIQKRFTLDKLNRGRVILNVRLRYTPYFEQLRKLILELLYEKYTIDFSNTIVGWWSYFI